MKPLLPLAALALSGCITTSDGPIEGPVRLGQTATTNGVKVRPVDVLEDSRCPVSVKCVWAGRVVVRAEVTGGSWQRTENLVLGKPTKVADGTLTLVAVAPEKKVPIEIGKRAYRFTFDFQGGM
jgi:hypothetical protein